MANYEIGKINWDDVAAKARMHNGKGQLIPVRPHLEEFIRKMGPHVERYASAAGLPVNVVLAQLAHESGMDNVSGQYNAFKKSKNQDPISQLTGNYAGLKGYAKDELWKGPTKELWSYEYSGGDKSEVLSPFRDYHAAHAQLKAQYPGKPIPSAEELFVRDYVTKLAYGGLGSGYSAVFGETDPTLFAAKLKKGKYFTGDLDRYAQALALNTKGFMPGYDVPLPSNTQAVARARELFPDPRKMNGIEHLVAGEIGKAPLITPTRVAQGPTPPAAVAGGGGDAPTPTTGQPAVTGGQPPAPAAAADPKAKGDALIRDAMKKELDSRTPEAFSAQYQQWRNDFKSKGIEIPDAKLDPLPDNATPEQREAHTKQRETMTKSLLDKVGDLTAKPEVQSALAPVVKAYDERIAKRSQEQKQADDERTTREGAGAAGGPKSIDDMFAMAFMLLLGHLFGNQALINYAMNGLNGGGNTRSPVSSPRERQQYRTAPGSTPRYATKGDVDDAPPTNKPAFGSGTPAGRTSVVPQVTHELPFDKDGPRFQQFWIPTQEGSESEANPETKRGVVVLADRESKKVLFSAEMPASQVVDAAGNVTFKWGTSNVDKDMQAYWDAQAYILGAAGATDAKEPIQNILARGRERMAAIAALDPKAPDYEEKLKQIPGADQLPRTMALLPKDPKEWAAARIATDTSQATEGKVDVNGFEPVDGVHTSGYNLDFDSNAREAWKGLIKSKDGAIPTHLMPVEAENLRVTSPRGPRWLAGRGNHNHDGVDIGDGTGTPLKMRASADGVILSYRPSYDAMKSSITIGHSDGSISVYRHIKAAPGIQVGSTVTQGQHIATTARAGTGMHAHVERWDRFGRKAPIHAVGVGDLTQLTPYKEHFGYAQSVAALEEAKRKSPSPTAPAAPAVAANGLLNAPKVSSLPNGEESLPEAIKKHLEERPQVTPLMAGASKIVLDAGHGKYRQGDVVVDDSGTVGNGNREGTDTVRMALLVEQELQALNYRPEQISLTRRSPDDVLASRFNARVEVADRENATVFASIHFDSRNGRSGTEVWTHSNASADSRKASQAIASAAGGATKSKSDRLGLIDQNAHPERAAVLVEVDDITNSSEALMRAKAKEIALGIHNYEVSQGRGPAAELTAAKKSELRVAGALRNPKSLDDMISGLGAALGQPAAPGTQGALPVPSGPPGRSKEIQGLRSPVDLPSDIYTREANAGNRYIVTMVKDDNRGSRGGYSGQASIYDTHTKQHIYRWEISGGGRGSEGVRNGSTPYISELGDNNQLVKSRSIGRLLPNHVGTSTGINFGHSIQVFSKEFEGIPGRTMSDILLHREFPNMNGDSLGCAEGDGVYKAVEFLASQGIKELPVYILNEKAPREDQRRGQEVPIAQAPQGPIRKSSLTAEQQAAKDAAMLHLATAGHEAGCNCQGCCSVPEGGVPKIGNGTGGVLAALQGKEAPVTEPVAPVIQASVTPPRQKVYIQEEGHGANCGCKNCCTLPAEGLQPLPHKGGVLAALKERDGQDATHRLRGAKVTHDETALAVTTVADKKEKEQVAALEGIELANQLRALAIRHHEELMMLTRGVYYSDDRKSHGANPLLHQAVAREGDPKAVAVNAVATQETKVAGGAVVSKGETGTLETPPEVIATKEKDAKKEPKSISA